MPEDTIDIKSYGRLIGEVLDANSLLPLAGVSITTNPRIRPGHQR